MVTQFEIVISQIAVGIVCFSLGMIVEHLINQNRWKEWKKRASLLNETGVGFWSSKNELSIFLALQNRHLAKENEVELEKLMRQR